MRGGSKSRNRLAGGGQISTTSERAEQAKRAQRRNTIVPATATTTAGPAPPTKQLEPQAASDASTEVGNDSGEDSDDFLESETGIPNLGQSRSESFTPFSRLFDETQEFMDAAWRKRTAADAKKRDDMPFGLPGQTQGTAADEITQSLDTADRPQTAIPPQGASRRTSAQEKDLRNLAHRSGPDQCTQCHRAGQSAIACPRCRKCDTYGHEEASCTWCYQCLSERCTQICAKCCTPHSHSFTCPIVQRAMVILSSEPNGPWESHSQQMRRALRQISLTLQEVDADIRAREEEATRGNRDRGKGREDPGPTEGESSGAAGGGGQPPLPLPRNDAGRESRSPSPRNDRVGNAS